MRLFIAIGLPEEIELKLEKFQYDLKPFARDAKWVNPKNIHLTLKFLGEVKEDTIPELQQVLTSTAENSTSVPVVVKGCGFFPNSRRPSVFWAGVEAEPLRALQQKIEESTERLGFEGENRPYSPHLTLARFKDPRGRLPLAQEAEKRKDFPFGNFTASEFSLYQSVLKRSGAEYTVLKSFSFEKSRI
jgi:2'-5' RNA ligase